MQLGPHDSRNLVELIRLEKLAFAAKLRMARAVLGWSQSELGVRVGLTQRAIHKLEQGETEPRRTTVRAIEDHWNEEGIAFDDTGDGGFRVIVRPSLLERPPGAPSRRRRAARLHLGVTSISPRSTSFGS